MSTYRRQSLRSSPSLKLAESVGYNSSNRPGDLLRVQEALARLGLLGDGESAVFRDPHHPSFLDAIRLLQSEAGEVETAVLTPNSAATRRLEARLAAADMTSVPEQTPTNQSTSNRTSQPPAPASSADNRNVWEARGWGGPRGTYSAPEMKTGAERRTSILQDTPGRIAVAPNPDASLPWWQQQYDTPDPFWEDERRGRLAVHEHKEIIEEEALRAGIDADLVKAVIFTENARGHRFGIEDIAGQVSKEAVERDWDWLKRSKISAKSIMPMNIRPDLWGEFGIEGKDAFDARANIRAGTMLIKRIVDRLDDPTPERVYTLYNNLSADRNSEIGNYFGRTYRERAWEHALPWYLRRKLGK